MAIKGYRSSSVRRVFTNSFFTNGMYFQDVTISNGVSRTIANVDISSNGDYAYPRPAFVNVVMDNFFQVIDDFPVHILKQNTSLDKTFLIGFENTVSEEDFLNDTVSDDLKYKENYGIQIVQTARGFAEATRRDGIFEITDVGTVWDGDTFEIEIKNEDDEQEIHVVRLLGIDTPEVEPNEPFNEEATDFAHKILTQNTFGYYTITKRYMQFDPATYSTDRTDSERTLAYILFEVDGPEGKVIYTLTEALLKAGLGEAQIADKFIYYDRFREADQYAEENELGIYSIEEEEEKPVPSLPRLEKAEIDPEDEGIEIEYVDRRLQVEFKIKNPNEDVSQDLAYTVIMGRFAQSGTISSGGTELIKFEELTHSKDYEIRVILRPTEINPNTKTFDYNSSEEATYTLQSFDIDLDDDIIEENAPFKITNKEVKYGFEYKLKNTIGYTLDVLVREGSNTIISENINHEDSVESEYTNHNFPLFEDHTINFDIRYATDSLLGSRSTLRTSKEIKKEGYRPELQVVGQDLDRNEIELRITNRNYFEAHAYIKINGQEHPVYFPIAADDNRTVSVRNSDIINEEANYALATYFADPDNLDVTSLDSTVEEYEIERLPIPVPTSVDTSDSSTFGLKLRYGGEDARLEARLYSQGGAFLDSYTVDMSDLDSDGESSKFYLGTDLDDETEYVIKTRAVSQSSHYSSSPEFDDVDGTTLISGLSVYQVYMRGYRYVTYEDSAENLISQDVLASVSAGSSISTPSTPSVDYEPREHEFVDWYKEVDGELQRVNFPYTPEDDGEVLLAMFDRENFITLYDTLGEEYDVISVFDRDSAEERDDFPEEEDIVPTAWKVDGGDVFNWDDPVNEDYDLIPTGEALYKVTFLTYDEQEYRTDDVVDGETVPEPSEPTVDGYGFDGWYSDSSLENPFDFNEPITEHTTVYSAWYPYYEVTFYDEDDNVIQSSDDYVEGDSVTPPDDPTKPGYSFTGWRKESESGKIDFGEYTVDGDVSFIPKFESDPAMSEPTLNRTDEDYRDVYYNITNNDDATADIVAEYRYGSSGSWSNLDDYPQEVSSGSMVSFSKEGLDTEQLVEFRVRAQDPDSFRESSDYVYDDFTAARRTEDPHTEFYSSDTSHDQIAFQINNNDPDTVEAYYEISTTIGSSGVLEYGTTTISGNGSSVVTASGLDANSRYYIRGVYAKADGALQSGTIGATSGDTTDYQQATPPSLSAQATSHYEADFEIDNQDSVSVDAEWEVVQLSNNSVFDSGSFTNILSSTPRTFSLSGLSPDTEYAFRVKVNASDRTESDEAEELFLTDEDLPRMSRPDTASLTASSSFYRARFRITNADDEPADIEYEIYKNEFSGVPMDSGTLTDVSPGEDRYIDPTGFEPGDSALLRNVIAHTTHEDGSTYRSSSSPASSSLTTPGLEEPEIEVNDQISSTSMGRGGNFVQPLFKGPGTSDDNVNVTLEYRLEAGPHSTSWKETTVSYNSNTRIEIDDDGDGLNPDSNYVVQARYSYSGSTSDTAEYDTSTRPLSITEKVDRDEESIELRVRNTVNETAVIRMDLSSQFGDGDYAIDTSVSSYGGTSSTVTFTHLDSGTRYTFRSSSSYDGHSEENNDSYFTEQEEGGGCLLPNTKIIMSDGTVKKAGDLEVGDKLLGFHHPTIIPEEQDGWKDWKQEDISDGENIEVVVEAVKLEGYKGHYEINGTLWITPYHRILVKPRYKDYWTWVDSSEVKPGDKLLDRYKQEIKVESIEYKQDQTTYVNFMVSGDDNYYAGDTAVVVHNNEIIK